MRELGARWRSSADTSVALVPTMGALHKGHGRLMQRARSLADVVVVSSFVNPLQFNQQADLEAYPRIPEADREIATKLGVNFYFEPSYEEMYPPGFLTSVQVAHLGTKLEGASRPGHFRGVCTVVAKLLNIVQPDFALFGHKDAQQLVVIQHMVRDLCIPVKIIAVPTERDRNGLALSSRNTRLSDDQKTQALCLVRALKRVHFLVKRQGILHVGELLQAIRSAINSAGEGVQMDYARIVSRTTLEDLDNIERGNTLVLVAATVGGVRLIDSTRL
jgi:pantoate--beta-alanine ligase